MSRAIPTVIKAKRRSILFASALLPLVLQSACAAHPGATSKPPAAEMQAPIDREQARHRQQGQASWAQSLEAAIERNWSRPAGTRGLHCVLHINLAPNGAVVNARLASSSGNPWFDSSALNAVLAASPLPLPADNAAFDPRIIIEFDPDSTIGH